MIKVYKKPKVAFISTGDEVVDIGQNLSYGKIFNSNKYTILARIKELGYEVINIKHVNDQYADIGNTIKEICTDDEDLELFLFRLGCYSGEPITVVSRLKSGCVVSIKDGRYNIDNGIAESILI